MDHSKRKNIYIIVFVVTTIIAASVAVYFGVKASDKSADLQIANKDMEDYKSQLEQAKSTINKGEVTVPKTEEKVVEKVVEKIVEKRMFATYDSTKYKKNENSNLKNVRVYMAAPMVYADIQNTGEVQMFYNENNINKTFTVTGLSGKAIDVIGGPIRDGASSIAFFLMSDGTVEKSTDLYDAYSTNRISSAGKVVGLSNIVRICYATNNMSSTPIAIDSDGFCYPLI